MAVAEVNNAESRRNLLVGIRIDGRAKELLDWAIVKVAAPGDRVVALHVCQHSDSSSEGKPLSDGYLDDYEGLCHKKQVELVGQVIIGNSIRKVLLREAKKQAAIAVILGISRRSLGGKISVAKYCAKRLPRTTQVLAIHNGQVAFRKCRDINQPGFGGGDPRPSVCSVGIPSDKDLQPESGKTAISDIGGSQRHRNGEIQGFEDVSEDGGSEGPAAGGDCRLVNGKKFSFSLCVEELAQQSPGWPLLRVASSVTAPAPSSRKMSVVQWVMSLPNRSLPESPTSISTPSSNVPELSPRKQLSSILDGTTQNINFSKIDALADNLDLLLKTQSWGCNWFSHDVIKNSTRQFSPENMIGKGGCNCVYKGILDDGKPVAVKILKSSSSSSSSKEAWKDFALEVDIMTSLKHKNITPMLGICIKDNNLISVHDFIARGSLEDNLHGSNNSSTLSWEVRFKVAVGIAEALHYLHNECPRPVIHRDVKSSNILLLENFEPQLSDFGLALWGPTSSSFQTHDNVVGTFGYLAPEYFMYGKVGEKIDVYSFGVVLLELLSGRRPIDPESPSGQESLVMWAKPKLENGQLRTSILDPRLEKYIDEVQMHRMVIAAAQCLTQAARLRPKMSQILKILRGEEDEDEDGNYNFLNCCDDLEKNQNNNNDDDDDEVYPDSSAESHLSLALLDVDDSSITSYSSTDQSQSLPMEEYLKRRWSRPSSLD